MSAPVHPTSGDPGPAGAAPWAGLGPGIAVLAATTGSILLRWPGDDTLPGRWAIVVIAATIAAGALLLAAGRQLPGAAHAGAWLGGIGLLASAPAAAGAVDDLVRGGVDAAPAPAVLCAAALLATVAGVRAHRDDLRWFDAPAAPAPSRSSTIVGVSVAVALASGAAAVRYAADDGGRYVPPATDRAMKPSEALTDATTDGRYRVTGAAAGYVVAAAGPYVLVESVELRSPGARAVDVRTGEPVWTATGTWRGFQAAWSGDGFVAHAEGSVALLDAATGAVRWRRDDLRAVAVAGAATGPAVLGATDDVVTVLDPASGSTVRELHPSACADDHWLAPGPEVVVVCRLGEGRYLAEVFGPVGTAPTWSGHLSDSADVRAVAAGVVLAFPGSPEAPTADGVLVDATSGAEVRAVPPGVIVAATRGRVLALVRPDGSVERWDADAHVSLGAATLDGGGEYDAADIGGASWRLVGGTLLAARRDGFGSGVTPASERRFGVVAWDVATGARSARTLTGRVLTPADWADDDPVLTDDAVVVPVRLESPDGGGRPRPYGLLVSPHARVP